MTPFAVGMVFWAALHHVRGLFPWDFFDVKLARAFLDGINPYTWEGLVAADMEKFHLLGGRPPPLDGLSFPVFGPP